MYPHTTIRSIAFFLTFINTLALSFPAGFDKHQTAFEQILSPNFGRINAIIRDDRGFLWFGTTKGLFKYDGYRVRVFPGNSPLDGLVFSILKMDDGSLLLGTANGLWTFDLRKEQATPFLTGMEFSESRIISVAKDPTGTLWIGTSSQGLFSYNRDTQTLQRYTIDNGLGDNRITFLLPGHGNTVWIGTGAGGLNALDRTTSRIVRYCRKVSDSRTLSSDHITALCEREERELWIGTDNGLNVLDLASGRMRRLNIQSTIKHTIMSIASDLSGRMWIAATDLGLLSYFNGEFTPFRTSSDAGRSLNTIMALYPDPVVTTTTSLLLWVGTHSGVDKVLISANPFTIHIRGEQSLELDRGAVLSLCEDRKGILWVGLWGGGLDALQRVNGTYRRVAHFEHDASNPFTLPTNDVGDVIEDRNENLWIGTPSGLAMLDPHRKQMIVDRHVEGDSMSLAGNDVNRIYEDHSGTIWICTRDGVSQLIPGRPHRFKNYLNSSADAHPLGGNEITDILEDSLSNLWVATCGNGLIRLERGGVFSGFVYAGDSAGTRANWIYNLVADRKGLFWLSTRRELMSFDSRSNTFAQYNIDQLYDEHIFGIAVDQSNDLWLSTSIGLAKFSPRSKAFARYESDDGIPFTELRSGFFRSTRGTMFVGGLDGFVEFCPDSITTTSVAPPIAITGFSIFDRALPATVFGAPEISLSYDQNFFSFSFAALDYGDPKRNSYTYRMVGLDAHWVNTEHRTYATYTNLDPGEYVFEVKGSNSDDVWNDVATSIKVTISPPYWRTWWFRIVVVGLVLTMIYSAYRYRLKKLLDLERLRLRIANDLHDDVGSNLSAIAMVSRTAQRAPELTKSTKRKLAEIYDTAVQTSESMKDLVWFIKPDDDTLDDLFLRMKDTASSLLGEIPFDFHAPRSVNPATITIDFKRNMFLAFKEILTNSTKHAGASKVEINIALRDHILEMVIGDNGKGFDETARHHGHGIQSLKKRALSLGGTCEITSGPNQGTTVKFSGRL